MHELQSVSDTVGSPPHVNSQLPSDNHHSIRSSMLVYRLIFVIFFIIVYFNLLSKYPKKTAICLYELSICQLHQTQYLSTNQLVS